MKNEVQGVQLTPTMQVYHRSAIEVANRIKSEIVEEAKNVESTHGLELVAKALLTDIYNYMRPELEQMAENEQISPEYKDDLLTELYIRTTAAASTISILTNANALHSFEDRIRRIEGGLVV